MLRRSPGVEDSKAIENASEVMNEEIHQHEEGVARPLAPEDVRTGDHIVILHEIREIQPCEFCCIDAGEVPPLERRRYRTMPRGDIRPLHVIAVAIPFIVVRKRSGKTEMLDLRRAAVARVDAEFARAAVPESRPKKQRKDKANAKRGSGGSSDKGRGDD
jgi:hypothetical protein